jgi:hypothetical protein
MGHTPKQQIAIMIGVVSIFSIGATLNAMNKARKLPAPR